MPMRATSACPDSSQAPDIRLATAALGAGLSFVFACPAVAAAGIAALAGGQPVSRSSPATAMMVSAACIAAFVTSFLAPQEVPRWLMIAFGGLGLVASAAATLAGLSRGLRGAGGLSAGFVVLLAAGALALLRPEAWICVAAATAIGALLASDHVRAAGAASSRF